MVARVGAHAAHGARYALVGGHHCQEVARDGDASCEAEKNVGDVLDGIDVEQSTGAEYGEAMAARSAGAWEPAKR